MGNFFKPPMQIYKKAYIEVDAREHSQLLIYIPRQYQSEFFMKLYVKPEMTKHDTFPSHVNITFCDENLRFEVVKFIGMDSVLYNYLIKNGAFVRL
jgi:hypothetical protein